MKTGLSELQWQKSEKETRERCKEGQGERGRKRLQKQSKNNNAKTLKKQRVPKNWQRNSEDQQGKVQKWIREKRQSSNEQKK